MTGTENVSPASASDLFGKGAVIALGAEVLPPSTASGGTENPPHDRGAQVVYHNDDSGGGGDAPVKLEADPQSPEQAGGLHAAGATPFIEKEVG